jgi:hypothetical protein
MAPKKQCKVFVSYSRHDEALVTPLAGLLGAAADDAIFFDITSLKPGNLWKNEIENALQASAVFVLCWCCESQRSQFVQHEIRLALQGKKRRVVPVLLCSTPLPESLTNRQWVDLRGRIVHSCTDHTLWNEGFSDFQPPKSNFQIPPHTHSLPPLKIAGLLTVLALLVLGGFLFRDLSICNDVVCAFTKGPRAGGDGAIRQYVWSRPLPLDAPCRDGAGSEGRNSTPSFGRSSEQLGHQGMAVAVRKPSDNWPSFLAG